MPAAPARTAERPGSPADPWAEESSSGPEAKPPASPKPLGDSPAPLFLPLLLEDRSGPRAGDSPPVRVRLTWESGEPPHSVLVDGEDSGSIVAGRLSESALDKFRERREAGFRDAVLDAEPGQPFGHVASALDALRQVQFDTIALAPPPPEAARPPPGPFGSAWSVRGLPRSRSTAEESLARGEDWVEISLDADGRARVATPHKEAAPIEAEKLARGLQRNASRLRPGGKGRSGLVVRVLADRTTPYAAVRWLVARCEEAGVGRMEFGVELPRPEAPPPAPEAEPAVDPSQVKTWVLRAHLPKDRGLAPDPDEDEEAALNEKLPIRVTLLWDQKTRQAKLYVGQQYMGIFGADAVRAAETRIREIVRIATDKGEIDAERSVPFGHVTAVMEMLVRAGVRRTSFAAPPEGNRMAREVSEEPECLVPEAEAPVPYTTGPDLGEVLMLTRGGRILWVGTDPMGNPAKPRALTDEDMYQLLSFSARRHPKDPANPMLSSLAVLVRGDRQAPWGRVCAVLMACARVGIWRIEFAVTRAGR